MRIHFLHVFSWVSIWHADIAVTLFFLISSAGVYLEWYQVTLWPSHGVVVCRVLCWWGLPHFCSEQPSLWLLPCRAAQGSQEKAWLQRQVKREEEEVKESFVICICFRLFVKLVLEAPCVTPTALGIIKTYCKEEVMSGLCVTLVSWLLCVVLHVDDVLCAGESVSWSVYFERSCNEEDSWYRRLHASSAGGHHEWPWAGLCYQIHWMLWWCHYDVTCCRLVFRRYT